MKRIIVATFMIFGVATALSAQDTTSTQQSDQYRRNESGIQQDTTSTSTDESDQYRTNTNGPEQDTTSTSSQQNDQYRTDDTDAQDTTSTASQPSDQYNTDDNSTQSSDDMGTPQSGDMSSTQSGEGDESAEGEVISTVDLPAVVRAQLTSEDYSGWTVSNAHRMMKNGETHYKVHLTNGTDKKKVVFDAQGNVLKEKDLGNNDTKEKDKY